MIATCESTSSARNATFFAESAKMAKKKTTQTAIGRPAAIRLTAEEFEVIANALKDASAHLMDTAKFMRENEMPDFGIPAAKILDEHLPAIEAFSRRAYAEVGPAATNKRLGRLTRLEHNQARYQKYQKGKKAE